MLLFIFVIVCSPFDPEGVWDSIKRFNSATFLCLSHAWTWIFNVICHVLSVFSELMCVVTVRFVDIGGIVYHLWLNLIFIIPLVYVCRMQLWYSILLKGLFMLLNVTFNTISVKYRGGLLKGYKNENWIYHLEINVIDIFDIFKRYNSKKVNFESRS